MEMTIAELFKLKPDEVMIWFGDKLLSYEANTYYVSVFERETIQDSVCVERNPFSSLEEAIKELIS